MVSETQLHQTYSELIHNSWIAPYNRPKQTGRFRSTSNLQSPRANYFTKTPPLFFASHSLPTSIVDIRLQFSCNHGWNTLLQPDISIQCIISLLIEEQLSATPEPGIWLTVSIKVRRRVEAAVSVVKVKYAAFSDVEEEPRIDAASV